MSFKFRNLIFKEEDEVSPKKEQKQTAPPSTSTYPSYTPSSLGSTQPTYSPPASSQTTLMTPDGTNEEYMQVIANALENRNIPGPDYFEFAKALALLKTKPIDEPTRYYSAFVGLSTQGLSKEKLIETANYYVGKIDELVKGFNGEIDGMLNTEIANKQKDAERLARENQEIEEQMKRLTELKNKNAEVIQNLSLEVNKEITTLNMKRAGFDAAAKQYSGNIAKDIQNIQSYL
jgi:hypothetical protein